MHTCHAYDCNKATKPEMFMCLKHWRMLPRLYKRGIWESYRPGQCDDWNITDIYAKRAKVCIQYIAEKENKTIPEGDISLRVYDYLTQE